MRVIILILLSLFTYFASAQNKKYHVSGDSLKVSIPECNDSSLLTDYYDFQGIKISRYYLLTDTIQYDFRHDKKNSWILILSPVSQEVETAMSCELEFGKRLLVILTPNPQGRYSISLINEDVILNASDYMGNPFRKIEKTKDGFCLSFQFGSIIYCEFKFWYVFKDGNFYLTKRYSYCFNKNNPLKDKKQTTTFPANKHKLRDIKTKNFITIPDL